MHVVSLLNGNLDAANGETLVLNVLQTLTCLLANNDTSKVFYFLTQMDTLSLFCCISGFLFYNVFFFFPIQIR